MRNPFRAAYGELQASIENFGVRRAYKRKHGKRAYKTARAEDRRTKKMYKLRDRYRKHRY